MLKESRKLLPLHPRHIRTYSGNYRISAHIFEISRKIESNVSEKKIKPIFVVQHNRCQSGNLDQRYDTFNDIDYAGMILADILLEFEQYQRK